MNKYIYFQKHLSKAAEEFTKFEKEKKTIFPHLLHALSSPPVK